MQEQKESGSVMDLMDLGPRSFAAAKKRAKLKPHRKRTLEIPKSPSGRTGRIVRPPVG